jgi:hypothetical protein
MFGNAPGFMFKKNLIGLRWIFNPADRAEFRASFFFPRLNSSLSLRRVT